MRVTRRTFLQSGVALAASGLVGLPLNAVGAASRPPRTLQEKVGQLFVVSFRGTTPDAAFFSLLQRHEFGGVVLYGRNYSSPGQLRALLKKLQASRFPLLVGV